MSAFRDAALAVRNAYRDEAPMLLPPRLYDALERLAAADLTDTEHPAARFADPITSHRAAASVAMRSGSQRHRLLTVYGYDIASAQSGLTADEARRWADLPPTSCYWKRCSELREAGLIVDTGTTRCGNAGDEQMVCTITDDGRAVLAGLTP